MEKNEEKKKDEDDPLAALGDLVASAPRPPKEDEEDPLAALDAAFAPAPAADSADTDDLFRELDEAASSLSTVCAVFFFEEYGAEISSPDDELEKLKIDHYAREDLVRWLGDMVNKKLAGVSLDACVTFGDIVAVVDKAVKRTGGDASLDALVQPVEGLEEEMEPPQHEAPKPPSAVSKSSAAASVEAPATPNTRRKSQVAKGIQKFSGMTLRGRTPEQQESKRKGLMEARLEKIRKNKEAAAKVPK